MEADKKALSDITVFNKYAKFIPAKGRRELRRDCNTQQRDAPT